MNTLSANLIPRRRLAARRVSNRMGVWGGVVGAGAVTAVLCGFLLRAAGPNDSNDIQSQLERVAAETSASEEGLKVARAELAAATRMLASAQELRDHPDWSALLQSISHMRGENVVLGNFEITPENAKSGVPFFSRPLRYSLRLSGFARDHRAATTFSLDLERTGVFAAVRLTDTTTQTIGEKQVVSFGIECVMDEQAGGAP